MEDGELDVRRWEDLDIDILVMIFQTFDIVQLTSGIGQVCSTWRLAACDPLLWKMLDLSMLKSNFIKIPLEPYVYVDGRSDRTLTRVLKIALNLSRGNILTLIFHYNLYVSDDQLTYAAERYNPNNCYSLEYNTLVHQYASLLFIISCLDDFIALYILSKHYFSDWRIML